MTKSKKKRSAPNVPVIPKAEYDEMIKVCEPAWLNYVPGQPLYSYLHGKLITVRFKALDVINVGKPNQHTYLIVRYPGHTQRAEPEWFHADLGDAYAEHIAECDKTIKAVKQQIDELLTGLQQVTLDRYRTEQLCIAMEHASEDDVLVDADLFR